MLRHSQGGGDVNVPVNLRIPCMLRHSQGCKDKINNWQQLSKLADGAEDTKDAKTREKARKRQWPRGVATC